MSIWVSIVIKSRQILYKIIIILSILIISMVTSTLSPFLATKCKLKWRQCVRWNFLESFIGDAFGDLKKRLCSGQVWILVYSLNEVTNIKDYSEKYINCPWSKWSSQPFLINTQPVILKLSYFSPKLISQRWILTQKKPRQWGLSRDGRTSEKIFIET